MGGWKDGWMQDKEKSATNPVWLENMQPKMEPFLQFEDEMTVFASFKRLNWSSMMQYHKLNVMLSNLIARNLLCMKKVVWLWFYQA